MKVYYDELRVQPTVRQHPWTVGEQDQNFIYHDFKARPELIPCVLEDFRPFARFKAIQTFYKYLAWLNGPDSRLESNDCAFRAPATHHDRNSPKALSCHGRIEFLFRELRLNVDQPCAEWLIGRTMRHMETIDPNFTEAEGVIGFSQNRTFFAELPSGSDDEKLGWQASVSFWAYRDTEEEAFANLDRLFQNLWEANRRISDETTQQRNDGIETVGRTINAQNPRSSLEDDCPNTRKP